VIPGLRKQLATAVVQVLNVAFAATTNADGTQTGHWTDDGGYARTLSIRGAWSTEPAAYPQIAVYAERGTYSPPSGGALKVTTLAKGQPIAPVLGGVLEDSRLHCCVRTQGGAGEDEREQLSDLLDDLLDCGVNGSGVSYRAMLQNRGVTLKQSRPDSLRFERQDQDPAHGSVVYVNDLVYLARSQVTYVPTPVGVDKITLVPVLLAAPPIRSATFGGPTP